MGDFTGKSIEGSLEMNHPAAAGMPMARPPINYKKTGHCQGKMAKFCRGLVVEDVTARWRHVVGSETRVYRTWLEYGIFARI